MPLDPLTVSLLALFAALAFLPVAHVVFAAWVRRRYPETGEFILHEGKRLHYTRCGSGPVVLLVHGANGTWNDFPPELIADLARDHTVLALDRPGHGWSDAREGPLGLADNAAAVAALLRVLRASDVTLVGLSYGAAVTLRTAIESPELVRRVVAVTPCTVIDRRNARYALPDWVTGAGGRALFHYAPLLLLPFAGPLRAQAWHPEPAPRGWNASRTFAYVPRQMHATARNFHSLHADLAWLEDHLPRLARPLLVLAGASDQVTPPARHVEWLRRVLPGADIRVLPGVGHWLVRLRWELVAEAVRH